MRVPENAASVRMIREQKPASEEMEIHPRNRHLDFLTVYRRQVALSPRMTTTSTLNRRCEKKQSWVFSPCSWAAVCVRSSLRCVCKCPWRPTQAASRAAAAGDPRCTPHPCPPGSSSTGRAGTPTPPARANTHVNTPTSGTETLQCGWLLALVLN